MRDVEGRKKSSGRKAPPTPRACLTNEYKQSVDFTDVAQILDFAPDPL